MIASLSFLSAKRVAISFLALAILGSGYNYLGYLHYYSNYYHCDISDCIFCLFVLLMDDICRFGLCRRTCGGKHSLLELRFVTFFCKSFSFYELILTASCCNASGTNWIPSISSSGISLT